jgi:hypothetical protein
MFKQKIIYFLFVYTHPSHIDGGVDDKNHSGGR